MPRDSQCSMGRTNCSLLVPQTRKRHWIFIVSRERVGGEWLAPDCMLRHIVWTAEKTSLIFIRIGRGSDYSSDQPRTSTNFKRRQWLTELWRLLWVPCSNTARYFQQNSNNSLILPCARGLEKSFCFCISSLHFRSAHP